MTQFAVRIGSILLICVAATPVVAGPRGGAPFAGGGVHFGGGGAPHLSTPHFSAPLRFTTPVGPQRLARPGRLLQSHVIPGHVGSALLLRSVRQIPRPTNQAANAFALSGVHRFGSGQILRNPFFVNRPVLAHTIFRGRFAQFSSRHHQHFLPIIAVGFVGPLFWPYAYDDFLNYTFYPYAYDAFWPGAYDDVYDGITGVYGWGIAPGYAGLGSGRLQPPGAEVSSGLCGGQTAGVTDWRINEIAQIVEPDEAQRADDVVCEVDFATDTLGSRGRLRAQQLIISFALQHSVRLGEARFGLPPFGKESCKDVSAKRHKQDGHLRAQNTVGVREAQITEMAYAVDCRHDDRNGNEERTGRGERWPRTGGKPQLRASSSMRGSDIRVTGTPLQTRRQYRGARTQPRTARVPHRTQRA